MSEIELNVVSDSWWIKNVSAMRRFNL